MPLSRGSPWLVYNLEEGTAMVRECTGGLLRYVWSVARKHCIIALLYVPGAIGNHGKQSES